MKKIILFLILTLLPAVSAFAVNIGEQAPDFELPAANGEKIKLSDFKGKIIVLEWMNPGCPYVKKHYENGHMQSIQKKMVGSGVVWLTINSTNQEHGDFVPLESAQDFVKEKKISSTAYLTDEKGSVGLLYSAKTTPHMFVIDSKGLLAYQGAIDDTPMGEPELSKNYVVTAVEELTAGKDVSKPETKSYGCSVKY